MIFEPYKRHAESLGLVERKLTSDIRDHIRSEFKKAKIVEETETEEEEPERDLVKEFKETYGNDFTEEE